MFKVRHSVFAVAVVLFLTMGASAWAQCVGTTPVPGKLEVNSAAAMEGVCGLEAIAAGGAGVCDTVGGDLQSGFVQDTSPSAELTYRASFMFNPNAMNFSGAGCGNNQLTRHIIFSATASSVNGNKTIRLWILRRSGRYFLRANARVTAGSQEEATPNVDIGAHGVEASAHLIELEWQAASGSGLSDGFIRIRADGGAWSQANIRNFTQALETARMGLVVGLNGTTSGSHYFDDFQSFRTLAP